jgi:hypothetical protein
MPPPSKKKTKTKAKGGKASSKKPKKGGGKKKKGKKGKKKKNKKKIKETEVVVVPLMLDRWAIRTQILRPRSLLDVGHNRCRRGRLQDNILNEIEPAVSNWRNLRELRIWGHGMHDAKRLVLALLNSPSSNVLDTLILRSNMIGKWKNLPPMPYGATPIEGEEGVAIEDELVQKNALELPDGAEDPLACLLTLPKLTSLDLSANSITFSDEFYLVLNRTPKIKILHLNGNSLGSKGCSTLIDMLPENSQLEVLGVKDCNIGPTGCSYLAFSLNSFKPCLNRLRLLYARGNLFGPMMQELGDAMLLRPILSVQLDRYTLNLDNYTKYNQTKMDRQKLIDVGGRRLQTFMILAKYKLKRIRLLKEHEAMAEQEVAAEAERLRLQAEKDAAKAAKKASKKGKKGKKGKKEKSGAGAASKKKGKKEKKGKKGKKRKKETKRNNDKKQKKENNKKKKT